MSSLTRLSASRLTKTQYSRPYRLTYFNQVGEIICTATVALWCRRLLRRSVRVQQSLYVVDLHDYLVVKQRNAQWPPGIGERRDLIAAYGGSVAPFWQNPILVESAGTAPFDDVKFLYLPNRERIGVPGKKQKQEEPALVAPARRLDRRPLPGETRGKRGAHSK